MAFIQLNLGVLPPSPRRGLSNAVPNAFWSPNALAARLLRARIRMAETSAWPRQCTKRLKTEQHKYRAVHRCTPPMARAATNAAGEAPQESIMHCLAKRHARLCQPSQWSPSGRRIYIHKLATRTMASTAMWRLPPCRYNAKAPHVRAGNVSCCTWPFFYETNEQRQQHFG